MIMPSLLELTLTSCDKLKSLLALGKLPSLKYLKIESCGALGQVDHEFYSIGSDVKGVAFPKLEELIFMHLCNWKDWELRVDDGEIIMPCLHELTLVYCPKLKSLPDRLPNALRKLTVDRCDEVTWRPSPHQSIPFLEELVLKEGSCKDVLPSSLKCLPNLKKLEIAEAVNLTSLPQNGWEQLKLLSTLKVIKCRRLTSMPDGLGYLRSLHFLNIAFCPKLSSLPDGLGQLGSLRVLHIHDCHHLQSLTDGLGKLKSLHTLNIRSCSKLRRLLDGMEEFESLNTLHIENCSQLKSLPKGLGQHHNLRIYNCDHIMSESNWSAQLKSLHILHIQNCLRLRSLPHELKQLTTLHKLHISSCQHLTKSCNKDRGAD